MRQVSIQDLRLFVTTSPRNLRNLIVFQLDSTNHALSSRVNRPIIASSESENHV